MTVSEVASLVGFTRATVRRFLLTLCELGYVKERYSRFELTPRVLELGYAYLSALTFPDLALPRMEEMAAETGESTEAAILDRGDVVYVARAAGPSMMTVSVNIGERRPAYATSLGRAILAFLPEDELREYLGSTTFAPLLRTKDLTAESFERELDEVRERGYALINGELEDGLIAVAVPVRDRHGTVVGAANISSHIGRRSVRDLVRLVPRLRASVTEVENALRFSNVHR